MLCNVSILSPFPFICLFICYVSLLFSPLRAIFVSSLLSFSSFFSVFSQFLFSSVFFNFRGLVGSLISIGSICRMEKDGCVAMKAKHYQVQIYIVALSVEIHFHLLLHSIYIACQGTTVQMCFILFLLRVRVLQCPHLCNSTSNVHSSNIETVFDRCVNSQGLHTVMND